MHLHRRSVLALSAFFGAALPASQAGASQRARSGNPAKSANGTLDAAQFGVVADTGHDQTTALQKAIDTAAHRACPLRIGPGRYISNGLRLPMNTHIAGAGNATIITLVGDGARVEGASAKSIRLEALAIDGTSATAPQPEGALLSIADTPNTVLTEVEITNAPAGGIRLERCGGRIANCRLERIADAAIFSLDALGLDIDGNRIDTCGNNGILVWQSEKRADGTRVSGNRIVNIRADSGGSGQNGNGVNVFRAGDVIVTANHISDCAYSAVRGNAADNISIQSNTCKRIGEVALYAEFGFQGAVITGNIVDGAATGIAVTNFNEGGRLAVVQGNLIRNLTRREHEPVDKRGNGIGIEADAAVTGNTIECAPTSGIVIGWGSWMRNVNVNGNTIRDAGIGIAVTGDDAAGHALITGNLIAGARQGAIRAMRLATPYGPDLATAPSHAERITVAANAVSPN